MVTSNSHRGAQQYIAVPGGLYEHEFSALRNDIPKDAKESVFPFPLRPRSTSSCEQPK
jgi:hypothetical protein